jgi:hypothetical protein
VSESSRFERKGLGLEPINADVPSALRLSSEESSTGLMPTFQTRKKGYSKTTPFGAQRLAGVNLDLQISSSKCDPRGNTTDSSSSLYKPGLWRFACSKRRAEYSKPIPFGTYSFQGCPCHLAGLLSKIETRRAENTIPTPFGAQCFRGMPQYLLGLLSISKCV